MVDSPLHPGIQPLRLHQHDSHRHIHPQPTEIPTPNPVVLGSEVFALIWVLIAQAQMGTSWRIGIDTENETMLITHGIFRLSRNSIFLGMRGNLLGMFFVLPNVLTLVLCLLGDIAI